ncbi:ABC transporter permease [Methylocaldum sp.]|uniref:ABC transporter permease n=1 Tax=Methylocaldum sp. TaxID=1969727 RepID=UPI002D404527|nr:FtsX-like permease family protein [Methylocaldum sp.]HYE36529.1 FtsX-like permease family protein [Methylocaldum sp.]
MLSGISVGIIALLLAGGFIEWIFWAMRESTILFRLGHIQVVRPGYLDQGSVDPHKFLLPHSAAERELLVKLPGVKMVAPRLSFSGLLSYGDTTIGFIGEGIDPEKEKAFKPDLSIQQGEGLDPNKSQSVIIGNGLAANLGVKSGDKVVLLANTVSGGINAVELDVVGVFSTANKAFDDSALRVPLITAEKLLRVSGAHRWTILLDDTADTRRTLKRIQQIFIGKTGEFQFIPWYDLADFYNKTVRLFSQQMNVLGGIIGFMILLGISNALIMSVMDRTNEVGTLMALGLKRLEIVKLFLAEGFMLGLIGSILGVLIGCGLGAVISAIGIPMPPAPGTSTGYTAEIFITGPLIAKAVLVALLFTFLASVFPAWKASRLAIVEALRKSR